MELEDYNFAWNVQPSFFRKDVTCSDDSDDELIWAKCVKKLSKKEEEKLTEMKLREAEEKILSLSSYPQNVDQFDRILLGQPNNSELWIKYMAFHFQSTEYEKVRGTAKKALKMIDVQKEQDRLNVWIALLNFENLYGTSDTLKECFNEAVRCNDDYKIYSYMLDIFISSQKYEEARQLIGKMCHKFSQSIQCWLHCCQSLFQAKQPAKARFMFQRALTTLSKKEHISFISRFALIENNLGSQQEAQILFEHILTCYPARIDLWVCYVDMLVKSSLIAIARQVLERACSQKLPARKMKSLYMKWLTFEEKHGNGQDVQRVARKAAKYANVSN